MIPVPIPFGDRDDDQIAVAAVCAERRFGDRTRVGGIFQFHGDPGRTLDRAFEIDVAPPEVGGGDQPLPHRDRRRRER